MNLYYLISKGIKKLHIPSIIDSKIDKTARICSGSHIVKVKLGRYSYVGNFCAVVNTKIGNFCSIADNTIIGGMSHPLEWVSTSPVFHRGRNIMKKNFSTHPYNAVEETVIGNDVWIGSNCLIKSGKKIGDGAVIGMGSVLTKDVGDYEIWAGNPAGFIRKRFDDDTIKQLIDIRWWEWSDQQLESNAISFNDVNNFLSEMKEKKR